ncbi:DUF305 domain-containing protein [Hymenobacter fodinae]|uniref:DUF305 domain-containing protein n=1 Tax=Hymenobacter fodinae TaxID=2510796 RepID=A0A4Z0NZJ8_9BACT|nr:DUF305 domain-containing protein [Hymenobacter fodinae]TGE03466.1 DUF305 domain-containing protein [Hymenobacter fodinae]
MIPRFVVGVLTLLLLGACRESTPETPVHTADTHQRHPAPAQPELNSAPAVAARARQRLRTVARSGNIDHDVASLLLEHHRGAQQLVAVEQATGRDADLRALADSLRREWQQESLALGRLASRTHDKASEENTRFYQEFSRDVQAACDSAARYSRPPTGNPDADFAAVLSAHLRTGLLLVQEGIAHGSDPPLIALAHRFHHDQLRHLRQVQAWTSAHASPTKH